MHDWDGCICKICGKYRGPYHSWEGCKCKTCGQKRDQDHVWDGCKCKICGKLIEENPAIDNTYAFVSELRREMSNLPIESHAFRDSYNKLKAGCVAFGTADEALEAVISYLRIKETALKGFHDPVFKRYDTEINVSFHFYEVGSLTFAQIFIARSGASEYLVQGHPTKFLT
jgi:hypothetical protein